MPDGIVRIGDRATFQAFRTSGRRSGRGPIRVAFLPAEVGDGRVRVAFAVGRPVGTAVARNRLRRRLRAVMRTLAAEGRVPPGAYLLSGAPEAGRVPHDPLMRMVARAVAEAAGPSDLPGEPR